MEQVLTYIVGNGALDEIRLPDSQEEDALSRFVDFVKGNNHFVYLEYIQDVKPSNEPPA